MEKTTTEKLTELLMQETLEQMKTSVNEKIDATSTSFEARLDGLKAQLSQKIDDLETTIAEKPLKVNFGTTELPEKEYCHKAFMTVMNILRSQKRIQKNIMLVGEAGSGKTHLCSSVAKALNLKFYPMSVGLQTTKSDLLGFINAHGQYITSPVREAFEHGGILLLDEFDSTHAGVVTIINSLLANGHCSFPDGIVEKNDKFVCIVACNTYGKGANIDYVGRNRLDGATLDRFITVDVDYDDALEELLTQNKEWLEVINKIRANVKRQGIKMIISPRASMNGADLLEAGFKLEDVIDMCILKGADADTKERVLQGVTGYKYKEEAQILPRNCQIFEIRTTHRDIVSLEKIIPKSDGEIWEDADFQTEYNGYALRIGRRWNWEFDELGLFFDTKNGKHRCLSESETNYLSNFFDAVNRLGGTIKGNQSVAFQFIKSGCRKPHKTLILKGASEC